MSKKLVKTAKQQFEERLRELGLLDVWKVQGACGRIGTFVWDNDSTGRNSRRLFIPSHSFPTIPTTTVRRQCGK